MRLGIIGGGAMGEAIAAAVIRAQLASPGDITVAEKVKLRAAALEEQYGLTTVGDIEDALDADFVIIAVKPQDFAALATIAGKLAPGATALSIMAGVPLAKLTQDLKHAAVVRAMPNTPAQIAAGMTVWTATPDVTEAARAHAGRIFESLGRQAYVTDERYLDMATGVSGSGPGFVFLLIEAMVDAAVHIGLPRDLATEMVLQTFAGTAQLALETGRHPADLRNMVTSPAGTTGEGLRLLEAAGVRAAMIDAVSAAYNKSKALGG